MAKRKILVTGCRGQLGTELMEYLGRRCAVVGVDVHDCDVREYRQVLACLGSTKPDVVVHAAAFTDVDGCETNANTAESINRYGTENVARACAAIGARLVYYSTDYVFDGTKGTPYVESDPPNPRTVYGKSKRGGEDAVTSLLDDFAILRIAWLYGRRGKNFVRTVIRLGFNQRRRIERGRIITPLKVVDDQIGNPCWTVEVARQTEVIIDHGVTGLFHATSEGETSWYGLACAVFQGLDMPVRIRPCTTEEYAGAAPRPKYSSLENKRLRSLGLNVMRDWQIALAEFLGKKGVDQER